MLSPQSAFTLLLISAPLATAAPLPDPGTLEAGKQAYMMVCVGCHQPHGEGIQGAFPTLKDSPWVFGSDDRLIKIVLHGLSGPMDIDGQSFNAEMPPQGPLLNDLQIAQVLTYVRNAWGNAGPAVQPSRVSELRDLYKDRSQYWSTEEILQAHPLGASVDHPLKKMTYALYEGSWDKLPDFDKLEPTREGKLPNDILSLKVAKKRKDKFGIRFRGEIEIPEEGRYTFYLGSDDGARFSVSGREVVARDGIHPFKPVVAKEVSLPKGRHPVTLEYFENTGDQALYLGWSSESFDESKLSDTDQSGKARSKEDKPDPTGIPLAPDGGLVRIYRNFIKGAGARAIGVGFPGGLNLAWDADTMRPALLWKGRFIDAARHWKGRGQGFQSPLEKRTVSLAPGVPFALLENPGDAWPSKDIRPNDRLRRSPYRFRGYRLGEGQTPTFHYDFGTAKVTDRFSPEEPDRFERTLTFSDLTSPLVHRVATGAIAPGDSNGQYILNGTVRISLPGSSVPLVRQEGGAQELRVVIHPDQEGSATLSTSLMFLD